MAEREQALRLKTRAVELLPDGAANLVKLQVGLVLGLGWKGWRWEDLACVTCTLLLPPQLVVESSAQRVIHLAGQWEKHRVPLLAEYRHLRKLQDCRKVGGRVLGCGWDRFGFSLGSHPHALLTAFYSTHGVLAAGIFSTAGRDPRATPECSGSC